MKSGEAKTHGNASKYSVKIFYIVFFPKTLKIFGKHVSYHERRK
jgi:hypothetical protein